ncbi:unnamed protein product [Urochloa humidicola]
MATPRRQCACSLVLLLVVACILDDHREAVQSPPVGEVTLLLQIKRAWGNPPALAAWSAATASAADAHCRWPYLRCDSAGHVTKLVIVNTNITGVIPTAAGSLSSLTHLDISNICITGMFPTVLYRCRSLQYLDLSINSIGGELPSDIGHNLGMNLSTLDLSFNNFNGTIPASLSRLQDLRYLILRRNLLSGGIPNLCPSSRTCGLSCCMGTTLLVPSPQSLAS